MCISRSQFRITWWSETPLLALGIPPKEREIVLTRQETSGNFPAREQANLKLGGCCCEIKAAQSVLCEGAQAKAHATNKASLASSESSIPRGPASKGAFEAHEFRLHLILPRLASSQ